MRDHAEHNEKVCDYLLDGAEFPDWVITTAFYSALHYVQHEIFPLAQGSKTYVDFETYYNALPQEKLNMHAERKKLVGRYIPEAEQLYRVLSDRCHSARYNSYKVSSTAAQNARDNLAGLKKYLKKP